MAPAIARPTVDSSTSSPSFAAYRHATLDLLNSVIHPPASNNHTEESTDGRLDSAFPSSVPASWQLHALHSFCQLHARQDQHLTDKARQGVRRIIMRLVSSSCLDDVCGSGESDGDELATAVMAVGAFIEQLSIPDDDWRARGTLGERYYARVAKAITHVWEAAVGKEPCAALVALTQRFVIRGHADILADAMVTRQSAPLITAACLSVDSQAAQRLLLAFMSALSRFMGLVAVPSSEQTSREGPEGIREVEKMEWSVGHAVGVAIDGEKEPFLRESITAIVDSVLFASPAWAHFTLSSAIGCSSALASTLSLPLLLLLIDTICTHTQAAQDSSVVETVIRQLVGSWRGIKESERGSESCVRLTVMLGRCLYWCAERVSMERTAAEGLIKGQPDGAQVSPSASAEAVAALMDADVRGMIMDGVRARLSCSVTPQRLQGMAVGDTFMRCAPVSPSADQQPPVLFEELDYNSGIGLILNLANLPLPHPATSGRHVTPAPEPPSMPSTQESECVNGKRDEKGPTANGVAIAAAAADGDEEQDEDDAYLASLPALKPINSGRSSELLALEGTDGAAAREKHLKIVQDDMDDAALLSALSALSPIRPPLYLRECVDILTDIHRPMKGTGPHSWAGGYRGKVQVRDDRDMTAAEKGQRLVAALKAIPTLLREGDGAVEGGEVATVGKALVDRLLFVPDYHGMDERVVDALRMEALISLLHKGFNAEILNRVTSSLGKDSTTLCEKIFVLAALQQAAKRLSAHTDVTCTPAKQQEPPKPPPPRPKTRYFTRRSAPSQPATRNRFADEQCGPVMFRRVVCEMEGLRGDERRGWAGEGQLMGAYVRTLGLFVECAGEGCSRMREMWEGTAQVVETLRQHKDPYVRYACLMASALLLVAIQHSQWADNTLQPYVTKLVCHLEHACDDDPDRECRELARALLPDRLRHSGGGELD
ncbi:unnamed protein product [Vitrella brassicaformis CCMP3155]|uniref:Telomere length regulation protein conserved domain-containing protein n=2 Tax=Vitrella brassicaformis TaxID=1169539 RepID=A0A0G4EQI8_VITBC|nr:unnamed protein product [Vitrella brassicaformis CCMP3155]|eukprot:CEL99704.1 unnamed protein product [Vitrella brassicaformis CCMP3155]